MCQYRPTLSGTTLKKLKKYYKGLGQKVSGSSEVSKNVENIPNLKQKAAKLDLNEPLTL